jgi:ribose transport system substrate-binding protein
VGRKLRVVLAVGVALALAATVAGCGGTPSDPDGRTESLSASVAGDGQLLAESRAVVASAWKGTYKSPDPGIRLAAKGKKIAVISRGQQSPSSSVPVSGAVEAAKALGWQVTVLDLKLIPSSAPAVVQQAIDLGVDGIVANFDCAYAPAQFAAAKARGIKIVPLFGFDCTDPSVTGKPGESQFTTFVNYGVARVDTAKYTMNFGAVAAHAVIAATNGTAKVIAFNDESSTVLHYTHAGFIETIKRCEGCEILEVVEFGTNELGPVLAAKAKAALDRHPDATVIRSAHSAATQLSIAPALISTGRQSNVLVIGGEGQARDLDLIRTKQGLSMTLNTDSQWAGWATVDSLNSAFNGENPRPAGFGGLLIDRDHNLPPSGPVQHNVNFKSVYRKAWGVGR